MQKFKAYPKENLELLPHTWIKGLDYEVVQKSDYFVLASNEGQTNITGIAVERLVDVFEFE
jgi:hypothetical protein